MRWSIFLALFSIAFGEQIRIGDAVLTVEIAKTHESRAKGLMCRTELAD